MKNSNPPDSEMWDDLPPGEALSFDELLPPPDNDEGIPNVSFEEAFTRLKQVVADLESGSMTLDQATKKYEEGMKLAQILQPLPRPNRTQDDRTPQYLPRRTLIPAIRIADNQRSA